MQGVKKSEKICRRLECSLRPSTRKKYLHCGPSLENHKLYINSRTTTIYVAGTQEIEKERGRNNKIVEKEGMGFVVADGFSLYTHLALILGLSFTYPYWSDGNLRPPPQSGKGGHTMCRHIGLHTDRRVETWETKFDFPKGTFFSENNKIVKKEGMDFVAADGFSLYTNLALILGLSFTYP